MIPPTGHKLFLKDLINVSNFESMRGFWFNSGTSALYFVIKNLEIPPQSKILIPAYTCPSVAAAVLRSGHKPILCDISSETLNYDLHMLFELIEREHIRAVVWVNLFGIVTSVPKLDIPVIVDSAQMGPISSIDENSVAAIYSFGRGKPVNALGGGLAVIYKKEIFKNIHDNYKLIKESNFKNKIGYLINCIGYKLFYHPKRYGIPLRIPWLKLGETIFKTDFELKLINHINYICIQNILSRLLKINEMRENISKRYLNILQKHESYIKYYNKRDFFRFPILFKIPGIRDNMLIQLNRAGILATGLYPMPLNNIAGLKEILNDQTIYKGAEYISNNLITLPVNEFVNEKTVDTVQSILENLLI